jgi:SAM-dependent methyltransferase
MSPLADGQRIANDRLWAGGRLVRSYATRTLRPVEADILLRYRERLSGRVLELGSGAGRLTGYLAQLSPDIRGIDLSAEMVSYSRRRVPAASFAQADLREAAAFEGGPYDVVIAAYNVADVLSNEDRGVLLDRIHAVLVADGLLVMSSHNRAVADRIPGPLRVSWKSPSETISNVVNLPIRVANRMRLRGHERHAAEYSILNDPGHDYAVLHYYVTRDDQARQLAAHDFTLVEALDLDGQPVAAGELAEHCSELHYVARRC